MALNELEIPEYHIVPSRIVSQTIKNNHSNWLNIPGLKGQKHNDNDIRVFSDKYDKYLNKWEYLN